MAADGILTYDPKHPSIKMLVLELVRTCRVIASIFTMFLSRMKEVVKSLLEYEAVCAMDGVGEVLCVRLIAEIGDGRKFHSKQALICLCGD